MKRFALLLMTVVMACQAFAGTPVEDVVQKYMGLKGARSLIANGFKMRMARPFLKSYSIAPLADKVQEMSALRMDKVDVEDRMRFLEDMHKCLSAYVYVGKSDSSNGIVDAFVHLSAPDVADELVVYNPKLVALYSLKGEFTEEELRKIHKKP